MNILINAYACSPSKGSEPGMAWNWIINLAKYYQIYVITEGEWKNEIEFELHLLPQGKNIKFYYNPVSEKIRSMCWNQGTWRFYYFYRKWQERTLQIALKIISETKIDLIHQLNMVGYREPGFLWKIKGIPKVWGPIGGFGSIPLQYLNLYKKSSATKQIVKQCINRYQPFIPYILDPIKKMDALVACNTIASKSLNKITKRKIPIISEVGAKENYFLEKKDFHQETLHIAWVGKNDERKALPIAFEVFSNLKRQNIHLHIYGIKQDELNIKFLSKNNVTFYGWLTNKEVQNKLQNCHALLFTSLFEATGTVVLEALSLGLPVLCHNTCGQGDIVTNECGYKIKMKSIKYSITQFTDIILHLYYNRITLEKLSIGALNRSKEFSWENNCKKMINIYEHILIKYKNQQLTNTIKELQISE